MLKLNVIMLFLLAGSAKITGGGWANTYFQVIRENAIKLSGPVSSLALSLGCIFTVFLFIKMYYEFVSDDQNGGFGGVRMWDILRPIVILIAIGSFAPLSSALDSVTNAVSSSLVANMNAKSNESNKKLKAALDEYETNRAKSKREIKEKARERAEKVSGITNKEKKKLEKENQKILGQQVAEEKKKRATELANLDGRTKPSDIDYRMVEEEFDQSISFRESILEQNDPDIWKVYSENKRKYTAYEKEYETNAENQKLLKKFRKYIGDGDNGLLARIIGFLFDTFFVVMMAFCEIMLCILLVFGPLSLALSILPQFKESFKQWIGRYIEVSMWKPIGSAIAWVTISAKTATLKHGFDVLQNATIGATTTDVGDEASLLGALGASTLMLIAGFFAMLNVPGIANSVLSLGSSGENLGGDAKSFVSGVAGGAASRIGAGAKWAGKWAGNKAAAGIKNATGNAIQGQLGKSLSNIKM